MVEDIAIAGVTKRFVARGASRAPLALDAVTFSASRGEVVTIVGPSGCGKSTLLRVVAGLEEADAGTIAIAGRPMQGVAPEQRDVAMVFQGFALYPHMTARQNLEFPLKMRGVPRSARAQAVDETASLLRIEHLLHRRPAQMSGGERQRVAMGRAMVRKPRVFLFDEPLSSLDAALRGDLRLEIAQLVRRLEATALYVTHDHVEAMTLGDRIAILRAGRLLQIGTPREVYERPASSFVGAFVGSPRMNILRGRVEGDAIVVADTLRFPRVSAAAWVDVGVRPEHVALGSSGAPGDVVAVEPLGAETHIVVRVGSVTVRATTRGFDSLTRGDRVGVTVDPAHAVFFDADAEGLRLAP